MTIIIYKKQIINIILRMVRKNNICWRLIVAPLWTLFHHRKELNKKVITSPWNIVWWHQKRSHTTKILRFIDGISHRYLYYHSIGTINNEFTDGLTHENAPLVKLSSVIFGMLASLSLIKLLMDLLTGKTCKKFFYPLYFVGISLGKLAI